MWWSLFKTKALETLFPNIEKLQVNALLYYGYHQFGIYFMRYSFAIFHHFFSYSSGCQRQRTTILELSVQFFNRWNRICWRHPLQLCRSSRPRHRSEWYCEYNMWCRFITWSLWRVRNQNTKCRFGKILHHLYLIDIQDWLLFPWNIKFCHLHAFHKFFYLLRTP